MPTHEGLAAKTGAIGAIFPPFWLQKLETFIDYQCEAVFIIYWLMLRITA